MSLIKDKYLDFRRWQQQPFEYHDTNDHHSCCNCGNEYENNYCPRCGQKAVHGPITWSSVGQGVLDVWGVGTRSLPYSLWQLIWRPGYLIRDYVSGKRQVSFPPVKMLVVVAVVLVLVNSLLGVSYNETSSVQSAGSNAYNALRDNFFDWMSNHIEWAALMAFSLFIIPVWFLFRQAPRFPRHTLPQGFYIQVFIGVQFLMFMLLSILLFKFLPDVSDSGDDVSGFMVLLVLPIMLLFDYKQLFGYGWWGTVWRVLLAILLMLLSHRFLIYVGGVVYCFHLKEWNSVSSYLMEAVGMLALIWLLLEIVVLVNNRFWLGGVRGKALWRPLLALAAFLAVTVVCYWLGLDTPLEVVEGKFGDLFAE